MPMFGKTAWGTLASSFVLSDLAKCPANIFFSKFICFGSRTTLQPKKSTGLKKMESNRKGSTEERKERASNMVKTGELEVMRAWFLRVFVVFFLDFVMF